MLENQALHHRLGDLALFLVELAQCLKLQAQVVTRAALIFAKHQIIQRGMQLFGEPNQGLQGRLCCTRLVPFNLIDVQPDRIGQRLLGVNRRCLRSSISLFTNSNGKQP